MARELDATVAPVTSEDPKPKETGEKEQVALPEETKKDEAKKDENELVSAICTISQ